MANKDNSERIERFLRDQMSPEENQTFLEDLKSNKKLLEEAQMMALLIKGMKEEQAKEEAEMKEGLQGSTSGIADITVAASMPAIAKGDAKPTPSPKKKWIYWAGAVAAMFVMVFGAVKFFSPEESNSVQPEIIKSQKPKKKRIEKPAIIEAAPFGEDVAAEAPADSIEEIASPYFTDPSNDVDIAEATPPQSEEEYADKGVVDAAPQDNRAAP